MADDPVLQAQVVDFQVPHVFVCCECFRRVMGPTDRCVPSKITEQTNAWWFGCWLEAGHFLFDREGAHIFERALPFVQHGSWLDGGYAPRRYNRQCIWAAQGKTDEERGTLADRGNEYVEGEFLVHHRVFGGAYTLMSWWDRTQGDTRGGCNSNYIVDVPAASTDDLLAWFPKHFPKQAAKLAAAGVQLRLAGK